MQYTHGEGSGLGNSGCAVAVASILGIVSIAVVVYRAIINFDTIVSSLASRVFFTLAVVYLANLLFLLRSRHLQAYAILEIILGCVIAWFSANNMSKDSYYNAAGLVSSVYFIIRGLDNRQKARQTAAELAKNQVAAEPNTAPDPEGK